MKSVIERIRGGEFPDFEERYSKGYSFATLGDVLEGVGKAWRHVDNDEKPRKVLG